MSVHDPEQAERLAVRVVAAGELVEQRVQATGQLAPDLRVEPQRAAELIADRARTGLDQLGPDGVQRRDLDPLEQFW